MKMTIKIERMVAKTIKFNKIDVKKVKIEQNDLEMSNFQKLAG